MMNCKYLLLLGAILLSACEKEPLTNTVSDNPNFEVAKLFTHAGCTVYRFHDDGNVHYFARCDGATTTETTRTEYCGKGCQRQVSDVATVGEVRRGGTEEPQK